MAALARQPLGVGIVEQRVGPGALHDAVDRHPARGIGDVFEGHAYSPCGSFR